MTIITIRNHPALKEALLAGLAAYRKLAISKSHQFFSTPGKTGMARADFIEIQLNKIAFSRPSAEANAALEILFCAICKSDIFSSITERLKNCLLTALIGHKALYNFCEITSHDKLPHYYEKKAHVTKALASNEIFRNLERLLGSGIDSEFIEDMGVFYTLTLSFSRTMAVRHACQFFYNAHKKNIDDMTYAINNAKGFYQTEDIELHDLSAPQEIAQKTEISIAELHAI